MIASELQGHSLDAESLRPFWKETADLGLFVFVHPLPQVIGWRQMDADDPGRMLGWEFSLMVTTVRLINSGLLDELPMRLTILRQYIMTTRLLHTSTPSARLGPKRRQFSTAPTRRSSFQT